MSEAETGQPARLPKPESLEAKFKLLTNLPYDARMKRKHALVFGFIVDWYHSKYGDALASVRHVVDNIKERDPAKKGLSIPHVHGALAELVEWGYLAQDKGAGKRASRYIPVWDLVCKNPSVTPVGNTSDLDPRVTPGVNTTVTPGVNTTNDRVTNGGNKDPSTLTRSLDPGTGKDDIDDSAAPLAPHADGLATTAAVPAEEFQRLYRAYGVRKNSAAAEVEFKKLDLPIADLIAAALAWKKAAGEGVKRMYLDRWLRERRYDEDPPAKYEAKPGKVKMPRKAAGATRRDVEIEEILWDGGFGPIDVSLRWLDREGSEPASSTIRLHGDDYPRMLRELDVVDNPETLEFKRVLFDIHTTKDGAETYRWHRYPDAANDNLVREGDSDEASAGRHLPWAEAA